MSPRHFYSSTRFSQTARSKIQHQVPKSFRLAQALLLAPVTLLVVKVAPAVVAASLHTVQCTSASPSSFPWSSLLDPDHHCRLALTHRNFGQRPLCLKAHGMVDRPQSPPPTAPVLRQDLVRAPTFEKSSCLTF
jgi:hypothetical protein